MGHICVAEDNGGGLALLDWTSRRAWDVTTAQDGLGISDMLAAARGDASDWTVPEIACQIEDRTVVADYSDDGAQRDAVLTLLVGRMGNAARVYFGVQRE